jgi:hypothetical protein
MLETAPLMSLFRHKKTNVAFTLSKAGSEASLMGSETLDEVSSWSVVAVEFP